MTIMKPFMPWSEKTIAERREAAVGVTGASRANLTMDNGTEPWEPWSGKVMVLAGSSMQADEPWLWLACRDCGWYLGFNPQHDLASLAEAGKRHDCEPESASVPVPGDNPAAGRKD